MDPINVASGGGPGPTAGAGLKTRPDSVLASPAAFFAAGVVAVAIYNASRLWPLLRLFLELCGLVLFAVAGFQFLHLRRAMAGSSPDPERRMKPFSRDLAAKKALSALSAFGKARKDAAPFRPDFVRYSSSSRTQAALDGLIELVVRDLVASWYLSGISKDPSFLFEVERGIQHAAAAMFRHIESARLSFPDFAVSRVLPAILQHIIHFKKAEKRLRSARLAGATGPPVPTPLTRKGMLAAEDAADSSDSDWEVDLTADATSRSPRRGARSGDSLSRANSDSLRVSTDSLPRPGDPIWTAADADLARHFHHVAHLHPAILPVATSTAQLEQRFLRNLVGRLLPELAPDPVVNSMLASKLVREIVACKVLHPLLDFLSDPDFWNEIIIKLLDFVAAEQLLSTVSEAIRSSSAEAGKAAGNSTNANGISTYEDLLHAIRNCSDLVEARLLLKGVLGEIETKRNQLSQLANGDKAAKAKMEEIAVYLNRLEVARARLDRRILRLQGSQPSETDDAALAASFSEPTAALDFFLRDETAVAHFATFMDRIGRPEVVQAWRDIQELLVAYSTNGDANVTSQAAMIESIRDMYDVYFAEDAPSRLEMISASGKAEIDRVLGKLPSESALPRAVSMRPDEAKLEMDPLSSAVIEEDRRQRRSNLDLNLAPFVHVQRELFDVLEGQFFPDFLKSPIYIDFLATQSRENVKQGRPSFSDVLSRVDSTDGAQELAEAERRLAQAVKIESELTDLVMKLEQEYHAQSQRLQRDQKRSSTSHSLEQIRADIASARSKQAAAEANIVRLREERSALLQQQQGVLFVPGYVSTYVRVGDQGNVGLTFDIQVERFDVNGRRLSEWTTTKTYAQFVTLHRLAKARFPSLVASAEFPVRTLVGELVGKENESRRKALDLYLKNLLTSAVVCQWPTLVTFLAPDRVLRTLPGKPATEIGTSAVMASGEDDFVVVGEAAPAHAALAGASLLKPVPDDGFELVDSDDAPTLATSALVHQFVVELFDLQNRSNYWRRQAWTLIMRQLGGGAIVHARVGEVLDSLVSENSVLGYLAFFKSTFWPDGQFSFVRAERTADQKRLSEIEASRRLSTLIPDLLGALVGRENAKSGAQRIFALFQNRRLNQELAYRLVDLTLAAIGFEGEVAAAKRD